MPPPPDPTRKFRHPDTGRMLILMWQCPNPECKEYFVPEELKNIRGNVLPHYDPNRMTPVCPHCKTDLNQWNREHGPR